MSRYPRCGTLAAVCLVLVLVAGGCSPVEEDPSARVSYAAACEFNPPGGHYEDAINVRITSATEGARIYYTTDQTNPSETHGQLYTDPIRVDASTHIRAVAYADDMNPSLTTEAVYMIGGNEFPEILDAAVDGDLSLGEIRQVTISCWPSDIDGYIQSVTVDLSEFGILSAKALTRQDDGSWSWQGKVQPMHAGVYYVYITAVDNQGAVTSVEVVVDVYIEPGQKIWSYATQGIIRSSPALADDGTIYVGSSDRYVYAFWPDGSLRWRFWATAPVVGAPAIGWDGTIYVGGGSTLFAIKPDGTVKWSYAAGGTVAGSVAIGTHGTVFFGSTDGNLYAVDEYGKLKWTYKAGGAVMSSPVVAGDGAVYFGADDGKIYAVYANGKIKWSYATGGPVVSSPAIDADGTIYVGSSDGKLYALAPDGRPKWYFDRGGAINASPTIGIDGEVYIGGSDGVLCAVNSADGSLLWSYLTAGSILSAPAVSLDGTIYFGSGDRNLYALSDEGALVWSLTAGMGIYSSPVIDADGVIYVGCDDKRLYAVEGSLWTADTPWPTARGNTSRTGSSYSLPQGNLPPVVLSTEVTSSPVAVVGRPTTVTVRCQAEDYDGAVRLVMADLSAIGGLSEQILAVGAPGWFQWSGVLTPPTAGQQTVSLTVRDSDGATAPGQAVLKVCTAPIIRNATVVPASLVWSQVTAVTVSCDVTDADGTIQSVVVNLSAIGGPASQALTKGTGDTYSWSGPVTPANTGNVAVTITALDNDTVTGTETVPVNVGPRVTNAAASAAGVLRVGQAGQLTVACTATNPDNTVQSVTADLTALGGPAAQALVGMGANQWRWTGDVTPPQLGNQPIPLTATDSRGGVTTVVVSVSVESAPVIMNMLVTQPIRRNQLMTVTVSCEAVDSVEEVQSVVADLRSLGGGPVQALGRGESNAWSWTGQVTPPGGGDSRVSFTATNAKGVRGSATLQFQFEDSPLLIYAPEVVGDPMVATTCTVVVRCKPVCSDGVVTAVQADLSALGVVGPQSLTDVGGGVWSRTLMVTPSTVGTQTVSFMAVDSRGATAVAAVSVGVAPRELWMHDLGLEVTSSPAVMSNGTVYIGAGDTVLGRLVALNPDGVVKWQYGTLGAVQSSPAIGGRDGTIYVGCDDHRLYAVRPTNGTMEWAFAVGGEINSSPAVGPDGIVFVGSDDGKVYAVDPLMGTSAWASGFATGGKVTSSPAVSDDGVLYVGSWDSKVYALHTADGTQKWVCPVNGLVHASPAVVGDVVYVSDLAGYLYAINRHTGQVVWSCLLDGRLFSSPVVGTDGTIYVGAADGCLHAVYPDGVQKWAFDTGGAIRSTPAVAADGTIYVGSDNNGLYAVNTDGTLLWRFLAGAAVSCSPTVDRDGTVYFASADGKVYAVQGFSGAADSLWPMFGHDLAHTGRVGGR